MVSLQCTDRGNFRAVPQKIMPKLYGTFHFPRAGFHSVPGSSALESASAQKSSRSPKVQERRINALAHGNGRNRGGCSGRAGVEPRGPNPGTEQTISVSATDDYNG